MCRKNKFATLIKIQENMLIICFVLIKLRDVQNAILSQALLLNFILCSRSLLKMLGIFWNFGRKCLLVPFRLIISFSLFLFNLLSTLLQTQIHIFVPQKHRKILYLILLNIIYVNMIISRSNKVQKLIN